MSYNPKTGGCDECGVGSLELCPPCEEQRRRYRKAPWPLRALTWALGKLLAAVRAARRRADYEAEQDRERDEYLWVQAPSHPACRCSLVPVQDPITDPVEWPHPEHLG